MTKILGSFVGVPIAVVDQVVRQQEEIESLRQQLSATTAERDMWARSFKNGGTETMQKQLSDSKKREVLLREFVMEWLDRQGTDENYMVQKAREALVATEPKP